MSLVHNERTKLTAAWLNTLSGAATAAGVIAPLAATFYSVSAAPVSPGILSLGAAIWLFAGVGLHFGCKIRAAEPETMTASQLIAHDGQPNRQPAAILARQKKYFWETLRGCLRARRPDRDFAPPASRWRPLAIPLPLPRDGRSPFLLLRSCEPLFESVEPERPEPEAMPARLG